MATVRCVGGGRRYADVMADYHKPDFDPPPWAGGEPCGWQDWRGGLFALPCPRCGGKVELVQPQPSP
jgi:hypothetical protein